MKKDDFKFGIGLKDYKASNDFLRCLWSRMTLAFGEIAWQYMPMRSKNTIFLGTVCVGQDLSLHVSLHYKMKGCLSSIDFVPSGFRDEMPLRAILKRCIDEALCYKQYVEPHFVSCNLDKNVTFKKKCRKNFIVDGNKITLRIESFGGHDTKSMFKAQVQQVCNLLTFDTLKYISITGTLMEEIRSNHNIQSRIVLESEGKVEKEDYYDKNRMFRDLDLSDEMADYINDYMERPYLYEDHFTTFDVSTQMFAEGIKNEELSNVVIGLPSPYAELAITNYMSALEIITIKDMEPTKCNCCGQMTYSIARRVRNLAAKTFTDGDSFVNTFYGNRSKYVHTGALLSSNNYTCCSIPLMSKHSQSGTIHQIAQLDSGLKEAVKACILYHEKNLQS